MHIAFKTVSKTNHGACVYYYFGHCSYKITISIKCNIIPPFLFLRILMTSWNNFLSEWSITFIISLNEMRKSKHKVCKIEFCIIPDMVYKTLTNKFTHLFMNKTEIVFSCSNLKPLNSDYHAVVKVPLFNLQDIQFNVYYT